MAISGGPALSGRKAVLSDPTCGQTVSATARDPRRTPASGRRRRHARRPLRERLLDFAEEEGQLLNLAEFFIFGVFATGVLGQVKWQMLAYAVMRLTVVRERALNADGGERAGEDPGGPR